MASTIQIKNSTTGGNSPSSLAQGEFAINVIDGNLFYGDGSNVKQDFAFGDITGSNAVLSGTLTLPGIADVSASINNKLDSSGTITTNDYAKFDASGDLVGRSYSEVKTDLSLNNVENTALSTYTGNGGALDNQYITNGAGYTTNTGTVTSVGGTGTVSGLSLSGTVTTSGNLTLGGTISISSTNITDVDAFSQTGTYASLRAQGTTAGDVGLGNVTNESKATMFTDAALTGNPTAPTPLTSDNDTSIATTAFVKAQGYTTNTGTVDTSGTPVDNDFAKFTDANTIEGRSYSEVKTDLSLNNVENTALSTWTGSSNITSVGTLTSLTVDNININASNISSTDDTEVNLILNNSGIYFEANTGDNFYFNQNQNDADFQVYSQNDENLIYGDSSTDKVGIGTSTPSEKLTVEGNISASGDLSIQGFASVSASLAAAGGGGGGTVTEVTVGTGLDVTNGTTTPNITLDLTEITLSNGLDSTATGLSLDLTEVIANDAANLLLTTDGDGTLTAENVTVGQGRMQFNAGDTSTGTFGMYTDLVNDVETATTIFVGDTADIGTSITTTVGYICNFGSSGWAEAQADATSTSTSLLGVAVSSATSNRFLLKGYTTLISTNFTGTFATGAPIYLSTTNSGRLNFSPPSSAGEVSRIIGHAIESVTIGRSTYYKIYFNPSPDWIEL